ncbi:hypothetical protein IM40_10345 (plasmid) [Candidatus Paracaedimonas acanthamoebae]|nr:hypothetical protein IM40_10345 [Candidatus Paracaedimonas acanthamoebae]
MIKTSKLLSLIVLTFPFYAKAGGIKSSSNSFSVLVRGGYMSGEAKTNRAIISRIAALNSIKDSSNISIKGGAIGAGILYAHLFDNKLYSGIELEGSFDRAKGKAWTAINYGEPVGSTFKTTHSYGASLRLGYLFKEWLPYIKLGILRSKWKSETEILPLLGKGSTSKYLNGGSFGFGVETPVNKNISVGGEFSQARYKKLSYNIMDKNNIGSVAIKSLSHVNKATVYIKHTF